MFQVLSCASYDYMKMCVSELQNQLQDLNSNTNKKLIQSASRDQDSFSSQLSHHSASVNLNSHELDSHSTAVRRHNPFDTFDMEDGFDRDSFVMDHYTGGKKARNFLEMHEDIGKQIREIMDAYLNSQQSDSLNLKGDSVA